MWELNPDNWYALVWPDGVWGGSEQDLDIALDRVQDHHMNDNVSIVKGTILIQMYNAGLIK